MAHSEQFWFERWLSQWTGVDRKQIREDRNEHGYQSASYDTAWAAWQERAAMRRAQGKSGDGR